MLDELSDHEYQRRLGTAFNPLPPILKDAVMSFAARRKLRLEPSALFEHFAATQVLFAAGFDDFDVTTALVGGDGDTQIDAIAITVNRELIGSVEDIERLEAAAIDGAPFEAGFAFVQATMSSKFPSDKVALFSIGVQNFFLDNPKMPDNPRVRHAIALRKRIYEALGRIGRGDLPTCDIYVVWPGTWTTEGHSEHATSIAETALATLAGNGRLRGADFHRIDSNRLQSLVVRLETTNTGTLDVAGLLELPPIPGVTFSALGYVRALDLLAAVTEGPLDAPDVRLREDAFYGNVRAYLGADRSVPVNLRIGETLTEDDGRRRAEFVLRNNGVTVLARRIVRVDGTPGRLKLDNFHIVNGSQTTHTLFHNRRHLDAGVLVPIKVIATTEPGIAQSIVLGLNRQTPIDEIQIVSRNEFVGRLKRHFDIVQAPRSAAGVDRRGPLILFERRTGEMRGVTAEAWPRVVTLAELMQSYAAAFMGEPHRVHREGTERLVGLVPERIFADDHDVGFYFVAALLLWRVRQQFATRRLWDSYGARHQLVYALRNLVDPRSGCPDGRRDGEAHEYLKVTRNLLLASDGRIADLARQAHAITLAAARATEVSIAHERRRREVELRLGADPARPEAEIADEVAAAIPLPDPGRIEVTADLAGRRLMTDHVRRLARTSRETV